MNEEKRKVLVKTIVAQMRFLGVEFRDDVGNRVKPGSFEEWRIVDIISRVLGGSVS